MSLPPWRSPIARALHRNRSRPYCRYLQLATVDTTGKPANRTVVFRGFVDDCLQIVTDGRSHKTRELQAHPWAEACWYFTVTREQFRIAGALTLVGPDAEGIVRQHAWQGLSPKARQQFYWPHPGHPREAAAEFSTEEQVSEQPPDSFWVLLLQAQKVDYLNLKGDPQDRRIYERICEPGTDNLTEAWRVSAVNP
ncbi:MAG: Npun_F5749 family FMN-dependent PPOX-type flavoprotein [Cyanobacteria bacterium J06642_11]